MAVLYYLIIALFLVYVAYFIYKIEKVRESRLKLHLLHANGILNSRDLKDKRNWFINKFNDTESHLVSTQASCLNEIDFQSIKDIRNKLKVVIESSIN